MGQRANLIVKRGRQWRLFYDHWCANRLDVELFWGPEPARRFIEQLDAVDESRWLDEVWCEGAAMLDLDDRTLLFFGGEEIMGDVPLRRAHLSLMRDMWPGWRIRWAHEGIVTVGAHVGRPPAAFLCDSEPDPEERFRMESQKRGAARTLLTATRDGITAAWRVSGDEEALRLGPGALDVLDEAPETDLLPWRGAMPTGGVHVDFDTRTLGFWWAHPTPAIAARTAAAWPGWNITWFEDRYEAQIERSGLEIRLPAPPPIELQAARIESLRGCCHWAAGNPARDLAARIGAATIGAATDDARGSVGEEAEKLNILEDLSRRISERRP